jgi:hypothetical protein
MISMISYLDDLLLYSAVPMDVPDIHQDIASLGLQINYEKSTLHPLQSLVYLGLAVDTLSRTTRPMPACLRHLCDLVSIVPVASAQDLVRIQGYVAWLAFAMRRPIFIATLT